MAKKKSFLVYCDQKGLINMLSDEEAGRVFKDLFEYGTQHTIPDYGDNRTMAMAFYTFQMAMDRDAEKYEAMCKKNRANARKRWRPAGYPSEDIQPDPTAYEGNGTAAVVAGHMRTHPVDADRDSDIDSDKDIDSDRDILKAIAGNRASKDKETRGTRKNSFHNFEQRDYDYEKLEEKLLEKQRSYRRE